MKQSSNRLRPSPAVATLLKTANKEHIAYAAVLFVAVFAAGYTLGSHSSSPSNPQYFVQLPTQPNMKSTTASSAPSSSSSKFQEEIPTDQFGDLLRFRTICGPPVPHDEVLSTVLDRIYNGTSPYSLGFPTAEISSRLLPPPRNPRGWGSTQAVFAELIAAVRPRTIIELGTFLGASALHMAGLTRDDKTLILCLDDFRGWPGFGYSFRRDLPTPFYGDPLLLHQFMLGVSVSGESSRVIPFPFSTGSGLAALCEWGVYGDLIEVDAGHDFHSAWSDINMAWAVLRPGGVLFGHDYHTSADNRGVRRAVTLFAKVKGLTVRPHGQQHWVLSPKPENDPQYSP